MERLMIEVDSSKNVEVLSELLKKFDFITNIKKQKPIKKNRTRKIDMPIEWSKNNADIMALAGIWKNKPRSIEEIREKAWKRD
jgi:ribosomal protein S8